MSRYLLDTHICIAWLKNDVAIVQRIKHANCRHCLCTQLNRCDT